jgi:hypothetical protein
MVGRIGVSLKLINNMIRIGKNYHTIPTPQTGIGTGNSNGIPAI